jgi:hypothetical protein
VDHAEAFVQCLFSKPKASADARQAGNLSPARNEERTMKNEEPDGKVRDNSSLFVLHSSFLQEQSREQIFTCCTKTRGSPPRANSPSFFTFFAIEAILPFPK